MQRQQQYVGIDLHRRRSVIVRMDQEGNELSCVRLPNDPAELSAEIAEAGEAPEVVLEATYGYYSIVYRKPRYPLTRNCPGLVTAWARQGRGGAPKVVGGCQAAGVSVTWWPSFSSWRTRRWLWAAVSSRRVNQSGPRSS
jgi:hypothetical protein